MSDYKVDPADFKWEEIFIAILAYAIENDEPFSADPTIMGQIVESMQATNSTMQLAIGYDDESNRIKYGIIMVPIEDEDKE